MCNSTSASICGLALSWKYKPHALGASQFSKIFEKYEETNNKTEDTIPIAWLCNGKLTKAWGLGGLFKHHSKLLYDLFKRVCNKSLKNWGVNQGYLDVALPSTNWR